MFPPDHGLHHARRPAGRRAEARGHHARRRRPLVPDHQPVRRPVGRGEHAARRAGAQPKRFALVDVRPTGSPTSMPRPPTFMAYLGLTGIERAEAASLSYGGQRLLDMGLALATAPHILLLDEPLAGLAAAERTRVAALVKTHLAANPGAAGRARHRPRVPDRRRRHGDERRRGAGATAASRTRATTPRCARSISAPAPRTSRPKPPPSAAGADAAARRRQGRHVLRQEPHPQRGLARRVASTRSSRCSAATAPANRRCSRR